MAPKFESISTIENFDSNDEDNNENNIKYEIDV